MEYVEGTTLRGWLSTRARSWREVLAIFVRVGRGLAAAHDAGLVHRDFKPDNVLVGKDGSVQVTDFRLARLVSAPLAPELAVAPDASPADRLTRSGQFIGSPAYTAPEQMERRPADARADVFSFCVALHEALYGARPFAGRTVKAKAGGWILDSRDARLALGEALRKARDGRARELLAALESRRARPGL